MDLDNRSENRRISANFAVHGKEGDDLISVGECKKFLAGYDLSDEQILVIRNCVIGITNSIINSYVDEFV